MIESKNKSTKWLRSKGFDNVEKEEKQEIRFKFCIAKTIYPIKKYRLAMYGHL